MFPENERNYIAENAADQNPLSQDPLTYQDSQLEDMHENQ